MTIEDGFRFHDLRASFKNNCIDAGIDKAIRDVIMGHALQGMDKFYVRVSEDMLQRAMVQYTSWFDDQAGRIVTKTVTKGAGN